MLIAAGLLIAAATVVAAEEQPATIPHVLAEIREAQALPANGKIDCDKVTPEQYERLGEAVMDQQFPNPQDHEWTNNMMGGDSSEMARAIHRMLGARYLGCAYGGRAGRYWGWPGIMGGVMGYGGAWSGRNGYYGVGPGMTGGWYGQRGTPVTAWVLGAIVAMLIVAFLVLTIVRTSRLSATEAPVDTLLRRYARGEITREQFEQMRKDITG
jgi:putative membrane protein